jgi:hypothetical protein
MRQSFFSPWKVIATRLRSDISGVVAPIVALVVLMLVGSIALAVDYNIWVSQRYRMQKQVDAAVIAVANAMATSSSTDAQAVAAAYFMANGGLNGALIVEANTAVRTVALSLKESGPRYFSPVYLNKDPILAVAAEASYGPPNGRLCVVALDSNISTGIKLTGNGVLTAPDCILWSNSTATSSLTLDKTVGVTAAQICAVGGISNTSQGSVIPNPQSNCSKVPDPFQDLQLPIPIGCDYTNFTSSEPIIALLPGVYCGGITISSDTVTAAPGIYVMKDGGMTIKGLSSVRLDEVTIYLIGKDVGVEVSGDSVLSITAPSYGPTKGIAIAMDPATIPKTTTTFSGNAQIYISGIVHLPNQQLAISGNTRGVAELADAMLIAKNITFGGGAQWKWTAVDKLPPPPPSASVRLRK